MFAPSDMVRREEFVKMLVATLDCVDVNAKCDFDDVKDDSWFYEYVASGVNLGLISGISENEFGTGRNISRQDIAVLINRAASFKGIVLSNRKNVEFGDYANISDYAKDSVMAIAGAGIVNGTGSGDFEPTRGATRAEAAKILYEFIKLAD